MNKESRRKLYAIGYRYYLVFGHMVNKEFVVDDSINPFCIKNALHGGPMLRIFYPECLVQSHKINKDGSIT